LFSHHNSLNQTIITRVDGELNYTHNDHLGSITLLTNAAGNEVSQAHYNPSGSIISSTLTTSATDRLFTGQYWEPSTGLVIRSFPTPFRPA
jgi:uncharacterized protein RhaS with RHS repeats